MNVLITEDKILEQKFSKRIRTIFVFKMFLKEF